MHLTNADVFQAREPLQKLMGERFPVMVSYKIAKLVKKLDEQFKVIEEVRGGLVRKYGQEDEHRQVSVKQDSEGYPRFVEEFNELMAQETEVVFEKVRLPEKVASTCDKCHNNMDRVFEIEPSLLLALDKFVFVEGA